MSGPVVVKIGGAPLDETGQWGGLWEALSDAAQRLSTGEGAGLILCHGGGKTVDRHLALLGFETTKRDGVRVTPPEHIDPIVGVLAGVVNTRLVAALRARGVRAVGVSLADAGTVDVALEDRLGEGLGRVGRVREGDGSLLRTLVAARFVPVVSSIGANYEGELLNVNADEAAEGVAACVDARALVLLTDVAGVLGAEGAVLARIDAAEAEALIAAGVVRGGMCAKIRAACGSAERLDRPVRIGHINDACALVCGEGSCGTLIEPTRVRMSPAGSLTGRP